LLLEVHCIKSEGNYNAVKYIVVNSGVQVDQKPHTESWNPIKKLILHLKVLL
jgi:hypothetical protein